MKKIFVDKIDGDTVLIKGDEHRHISLSLRSKVGDEIIVSCLDDYKYICTISSITKNETVLRVIKKEKDLSESDLDVSLYFCVLKGENNDIVVQKSTELGVNKLIPVISKNCVAKTIKQDRLSKIALESSKQCGRNKIPQVSNQIDFLTAINQIKAFDLCFFAYEKENTLHIKEFLSKNLALSVLNVAILIGPEGGFTDEEANLLISSGIKPVSLGNRILRAETASISALTCIMYQSENL